jgi:hypothetical protein
VEIGGKGWGAATVWPKNESGSVIFIAAGGFVLSESEEAGFSGMLFTGTVADAGRVAGAIASVFVVGGGVTIGNVVTDVSSLVTFAGLGSIGDEVGADAVEGSVGISGMVGPVVGCPDGLAGSTGGEMGKTGFGGTVAVMTAWGVELAAAVPSNTGVSGAVEGVGGAYEVSWVNPACNPGGITGSGEGGGAVAAFASSTTFATVWSAWIRDVGGDFSAGSPLGGSGFDDGNGFGATGTEAVAMRLVTRF